MSDDPRTAPNDTGSEDNALPDLKPAVDEPVPDEDLAEEPVLDEPVVEEAVETWADDAPAAPVAPRSMGLLIGLGVLVLALLVGVVWGGVAWMDRRQAADSERAAVAVGRQAALNVFSFDYRKVEDQLKVIQKTAGGRFATEFTNSRDALIKVVKTEQRVSNSRVVEAAVVTAGPSSVQLLVALNEFRVTKTNPKGVPILQRVLLELRKTAGQWKLVELRPVA